jgi:prephenate dehydrogenase
MQASQSITIIGVGLLGGSLGLALRAAGFGGKLVGVGRRQESLDEALAFRCIDEATCDLAQGVADADMVVLATPVGAYERILQAIEPALKDHAVVTDVGSTKRQVVALGNILIGPGRFVGSHPMAGLENKGVAFARADLFEGARCILTPTDETDPELTDRIEELWKTVGMKTLRMTPDAHDRAVAHVSHLPQILASLLMGLPSDNDLKVAANGFRDCTRLAGGDPEMWRDILLTNPDPIADTIDAMQSELDKLKAIMLDGDAEKLEAIFTAARDRRAETIAQQIADHRVSAE